jgi:hypothetical protein
LVRSTFSGEVKKEEFALRSGVAKEYAGDRYARQYDQKERWLAEHQHNESVEKALASVSKFSYDPEDYVRFLVKAPFHEPARQEFQMLLPERILATELKYRRPILKQWGVMVALILSAAVFPNLIILGLVSILLAGVGFLQYKTLMERQRVLSKLEIDTRLEIENLTRQQEETIDEQRREHEKAEEERVDYYVRLMNGEEPVVILVLDEFLSQIPLPFPVDLDISLHGKVFLIQVWLPSKVIIPSERSILTEAGKIRYEKKDSIEINKQYVELCAALLMQVSSILLAKIPAVEGLYVCGISKDGKEDEYLMTMQMNRSQMERVQRASTALVALQGVSAIYECDEFLKLMPVEPLLPEGWSEIDIKEIRKLRIKIYKWAVPGMRNKIVENN